MIGGRKGRTVGDCPTRRRRTGNQTERKHLPAPKECPRGKEIWGKAYLLPLSRSLKLTCKILLHNQAPIIRGSCQQGDDALILISLLFVFFLRRQGGRKPIITCQLGDLSIIDLYHPTVLWYKKGSRTNIPRSELIKILYEKQKV